MATIKTVLKFVEGKPRLTKSGETTIFLKYTHDTKHILISSGVRIQPDQWDGDENQAYPVKGQGRRTKNDLISQARQKLERIIFNIQSEGREPAVDEVKKRMARKAADDKQDVLLLFDEYIDYSRSIKSPGTVKLILRAKADFVAFCQRKKFTPKLSEIDLRFYDGYVKYLFEVREMKSNTVGKCIKDLKAFLNFCKKRGYKVSPEVRKFKVLKEDTVIIYLTQQELETLWQYDFTKNDRYQKARDIFCLQAYTGLRWSDVKRLGRQHITENVVRMTAFKTKKPIVVPLQPKALKVLERFNYEMPEVTEQEVNRVIKEACKIAGIDSSIEVAIYQGGKKTFTKVEKWKKVSTHTAVKTFITHCAEKGISPKVVATITGKTVDVILRHYYGTDEKQIISEINKAFGNE